MADKNDFVEAEFFEDSMEITADIDDGCIFWHVWIVASSMSTIVPAYVGKVVAKFIDKIGPDKAVAGQAIAQNHCRAFAHGSVPDSGAVVGGMKVGVLHGEQTLQKVVEKKKAVK